MKSTRAVALVLTLTLTLGPVATARAAVPEAGGFAQCSPAAERAVQARVVATRQDAVLVQHSGGELVEILSGAQARDHLYELARRRPARFKTFASELESREGYEPTEEVTVARTITFGSAKDLYRDVELPMAVPAAKAQTAKGEVIFWSWNDGDHGTWEGSMYVEDYQTGKWITGDGQADISTGSYRSIWAKKTGFGKGGGGNDLPVDRRLSPSPDRAEGFVQAAWSNPFDEEYYAFWLCVAGGCVACAVSCAATGPGWAPCATICCVSVIVTCAIQEFLK